MTRSLHETVPDASELERLATVSDALEREGPEATLAWALDEFESSIAIGTGFGVEGVAMIDMAARLRPNPPVFFIDTGFLFPETYDLRRRLEDRYGFEIRAVEPQLTPQQQEDAFGSRLWAFDPDFCCSLRKVEPLETFLDGYAAWVTAIRRDQTRTRGTARALDWDAGRGLVKVSPLVTWTRDRVWEYVRENDVPYNALHDRGYPSIGCTHCTRAVKPGEDERAGRWAGFQKTECGLHNRPAK